MTIFFCNLIEKWRVREFLFLEGFLSLLLAKWLVLGNYVYSDFMITRGYLFRLFHRCAPCGKESEHNYKHQKTKVHYLDRLYTQSTNGGYPIAGHVWESSYILYPSLHQITVFKKPLPGDWEYFFSLSLIFVFFISWGRGGRRNSCRQAYLFPL